MAERIDASIIIPAYNGERYIRNCLQSAVSQESPYPYEVIIIDDGSDDDTVRVAKEFASRYPHVRFASHGTNQGVSAARNTAMEMSRGEFIFYLDADDLIYPHAVETVVDCLSAGEEGLLYSDQIDIEENGQPIRFRRKPEYSQEMLLHFCYPGVLKAWKREVMEEIGGFDTGFNNAEDYDFLLRASEKFDFFHTPELLYAYRINPDGLSRSGRTKQMEAGERAVTAALKRRGRPFEAKCTGRRICSDGIEHNYYSHVPLEGSEKSWVARKLKELHARASIF